MSTPIDDALNSIASKAAENLVEPILSPFQSLDDFNNNLEDLKKETAKLESMKLRVSHLIERAQRNGEQIEPNVQTWLLKVDEIIEQVEKLEDDIKLKTMCCYGWCPNISFRLRTSTKLRKKQTVVARLQEEGKFTHVSRPLSPPGIESHSHRDFWVFESTRSTMNEIMEDLENVEIKIIGVYGPRGVGKTALVKEVGKKAKEMKLFDEVVFGIVSKTPNLRKNQGQIADMLGLKLGEESEQGRARRIYARMQNRNVLVILDDVWARIDLDDLGIPLDHRGSKVVLTTRKENVCNAIGTRTKKIQLNVLTEEESWALFGQIIGGNVDSLAFNAVGREIARECGGLPLMLVTIGRKLRNRSLEEWKVEAEKLKKFSSMEKGKGEKVDFLNEYNH